MKPGDTIAKLIESVTTIQKCLSCSKRARIMNEWGWKGCWSNRHIIYKWLRQYKITQEKINIVLLEGANNETR